MSLEAATYISDLNVANPPAGDPVSQAADHLRLIKSVIKTTFPNVTGAVTARQDQINNAMPAGAIIMWSGAAIPTGWALCNGGTYAKADGSGNVVVPNLINYFPVCAGSSYALNTIGGAVSAIPAGAISAYALVANDLPAHNHAVNDPGHTHGINDPGHTHGYSQASGGLFAVIGSGVQSFSGNVGANTNLSYTGTTANSATTGITTANTGGNAGHTHAFSGYGMSIIPPYYALYFIFKL